MNAVTPCVLRHACCRNIGKQHQIQQRERQPLHDHAHPGTNTGESLPESPTDERERYPHRHIAHVEPDIEPQKIHE